MNDYISREDVQGQIVKAAEKCQIKLFDKSVNVILQILQNMPTADVQPVKRGKWEIPVSVGNGIHFCSVCRNEAYWDTDYGQQLFDYCPYCGARMKED